MRILLAVAVLTWGSLFAQPTGEVSGILTSAEGKPLSGFVSLAGTSVVFHDRKTVGADGVFRFTAVPDGEFVLCAHVPALPGSDTARPFVDTCVWRPLARTVRVAAGQRHGGLAVAIPRGTHLRVRLSDPQRLLSTQPAERNREVQVAVRGGDLLVRPLGLEKVEASARTYSAVVPVSASVTLQAGSPVFDLAEAGGAPAMAERTVAVGAVSPPGEVLLTVERRKAGR